MPQKDKNSSNRERKKNQKGKDTLSIYSQKHIRNTLAILDRQNCNSNTTMQKELSDDTAKLKEKKDKKKNKKKIGKPTRTESANRSNLPDYD